MKRILILGGGTGGTIVANRLRRELDDEWNITVIDRSSGHHYQPGYLFIPFSSSSPEKIVKDRASFFSAGIDYVEKVISRLDCATNRVIFDDGEELEYTWLIVASGARIRPDLTPGMKDGELWGKDVFDFYTKEGATALRERLSVFDEGRLVVHVTDMPIKCPVAPLEFTLLAEDMLRKRHIRHKVDITYVTPLDAPFTKPIASRELSSLLEERSIFVETDFATESIDNENHEVVSYDGRRIPFDVLVTVPLHTGQAFIEDSDIGDEMQFVPVDKYTLRSTEWDNVFGIGDATNLPTSKAGAVVHFSAPVVVENLLAAIDGRELPEKFDGHANCFIESGRGEALLLDFNYDQEPLTGHFPTPAGPMKLLGRSKINHMGKLAFEQIYWRVLLPGYDMPISDKMSMWGKKEEN